ncbi:MAG: hypothetical protein IJP93_04075 [Bacteroidales bacterium]|nr:hypothetical protein [Bacteroidales bacterium]
MLVIVFLLSALSQITPISLPALAANIVNVCTETEKDPKLIDLCEKVSDKGLENSSDIRELFLKVPMSGQELDYLVSSQLSDGSWADINYADTNKGSWSPSLHAFRIQRLGIKYCRDSEQRALDCALKALDYWFSNPVAYTNWWHKEIGIPRLLGPAFIMLKDKMGAGRTEKALELMAASGLRMSGQNKIWLAGNVLLGATLTGNEEMAINARNALVSEMHFSDGNEGVQRDYSFHQHGPQFQSGNYGLSYAVTLSWWASVLKGTGLDFPAEQLSFLRDYILNGLNGLVWNGYFDPNACARQVFPNAQIGKALCVRYAASNMGLSLDSSSCARYYPSSDFCVFRGDGWYASLRMQSSRTVGFENTNNENMKGYFSADGALLVRVEGDEYDDIWPVWDWHHIPGVTSWDDGFPIWGKRNGNGAVAKTPYNKSAKVSGIVRDGCMIAAMDYDRDTLTCRKAWFFFDKGIVCLGSGITKPGTSVVTTTIEQNRAKGCVHRRKHSVTHRGITYIMLKDADYRVNKGIHSGRWNWMNPALPDNVIQEPVFEMIIHHGINPLNASYAYAIIPRMNYPQAKHYIKSITILENTRDRQQVVINGRTMTIDWEPFSFHLD